MFPQRNLLRTPQSILSRQWRAPLPSVAQRRLNTFRLNDDGHVPLPPWAQHNDFNRERDETSAHAQDTSSLWLKIIIFGVVPTLAAGSWNTYRLWQQHWEHWNEMPPLDQRTEYPYQNIRVKNYPWGNGDTTAFWNPKVNYHKPDKEMGA